MLTYVVVVILWDTAAQYIAIVMMGRDGAGTTTDSKPFRTRLMNRENGGGGGGRGRHTRCRRAGPESEQYLVY